jgi:phenylacetate-CoA ligase
VCAVPSDALDTAQHGAKIPRHMSAAERASQNDARYRAQIAALFERSTFYRDKLRAHGFDSAASVGGLDGIAALPFTTKDELRESQHAQPPLGTYAAIELAQAARIYSTSGTSGVPSYIPLTHGDLLGWREVAQRSYARNGLAAGQRVVTTYNAGPFVAGAALDAFDALGLTHVPVGTGNTDRLVTALRLLRPHALICTPSYAFYIAEWATKKGWPVRGAGLERVIVAGEPGGGEASFRRALEDAYAAPVYEVMGIGDIAASLFGECPEQAGMHFSGDGLIHVELVDPQTGKPVDMADGATGELVYTHLQREAAPLLRFRSRDHALVWTSRCACGRDSLRVRCIGRTDDMLIVRGVNVFPTAIREIVARFQPRVTGAVQVRPRRAGTKQDPPLPVLVELAEGIPPAADLADAIASELRSVLLFTSEVHLVRAQSLPRSDYKSKLVDYSDAAAE